MIEEEDGAVEVAVPHGPPSEIDYDTLLAAAEEATGTMTGAPAASEEVPVASIEAPRTSQLFRDVDSDTLL